MDNNGYNNLDSSVEKNNESLKFIKKSDETVTASIILIIMFGAAIVFFVFKLFSFEPYGGGPIPDKRNAVFFVYLFIILILIGILLFILGILWGVKIIKYMKKKKKINCVVQSSDVVLTPNYTINENSSEKQVVRNNSESVMPKKKSNIEVIGVTVALVLIFGPYILEFIVFPNSLKNAILGIGSLILFVVCMFVVWRPYIKRNFSEKKNK